jgi:voltage-gated potassium channel Kch
MAFESYDDLGDFFGLEDFAIEAKFIKSGKSVKILKGIFDNPQVARGMSDNLEITIPMPKFMCRTEDIPEAADGDKLKINGVEYYIRVEVNDGEGVSTLYLEKV